jgi:hypothetical protein
MSEPGFEPGLTESERAEHQRQSKVRPALRPTDRFPHTVAAAGPLTSCGNQDFHCEVGVEMFIAGAEALSRQ